MISAWQSLTVSPLRLSSSPLTQRFPDNKNEREREEKKDKFNVKKHNNAAPLGSAMT